MRNLESVTGPILRAARQYRDATAESLSQMVQVPSLSCEEKDVIDRIDSVAAGLGLENRRVDGLGNLIIQVGSGPRVLAIDAHIDTVDVGDPDQWTLDPFSGLIRDGFVHGRGTKKNPARPIRSTARHPDDQSGRLR